MPQTMIAPSTSTPGSKVYFDDGSSATIASDGSVVVPNNQVGDMINAGFTFGAFLSNGNVIGAQGTWHRFDLAAAALGDTDIVLTYKERIIDAFLVLRGAGVSTTTLTVKNGATAITDAMAASGSDKALVRAATIDDAQWEVAAGGTLRVTSATGATQPAATVFVLGVRIAP